MSEARAADQAGREYEAAEEAFLQGVRDDLGKAALGTLAEQVSELASEWNSAEYKALHAASGAAGEHFQFSTERTEVLDQLWRDIARAFQGLPAYRDG